MTLARELLAATDAKRVVIDTGLSRVELERDAPKPRPDVSVPAQKVRPPLTEQQIAEAEAARRDAVLFPVEAEL